jgi:ribosomal protein S12 methylthiotransferase accessory factor
MIVLDTSGIADAIGVTRVARITGLDRTGVEVASAIRPGGHVLQVCNGKGLTFDAAAGGAVLEACELFGAERPPVLRLASITELRAEVGEDLLPPDALGAEPDPALSSARIGWAEATDLLTGEPVLVPAHALFCPPVGAAPLGPALVSWSSNGMGAHPDRDAALLHALLEAIERDRLARAFPAGLDPASLRRRLIAPASLARTAPRTAALAERLRERRFDVHLLDAVPEGDALGLPVAAALLVDRDEGPVPIAAGYACRLRRDDALLSALLEAAQSRLTEIHGAREDVAVGGRDHALPIAAACARVRPSRAARALPDVRAGLRAGTARAGVRLVLSRLRRAGFARAVVAELPSPPGASVVKVLVPGLLLSELL